MPGWVTEGTRGLSLLPSTGGGSPAPPRAPGSFITITRTHIPVSWLSFYSKSLRWQAVTGPWTFWTVYTRCDSQTHGNKQSQPGTSVALVAYWLRIPNWKSVLLCLSFAQEGSFCPRRSSCRLPPARCWTPSGSPQPVLAWWQPAGEPSGQPW